MAIYNPFLKFQFLYALVRSHIAAGLRVHRAQPTGAWCEGRGVNSRRGLWRLGARVATCLRQRPPGGATARRAAASPCVAGVGWSPRSISGRDGATHAVAPSPFHRTAVASSLALLLGWTGRAGRAGPRPPRRPVNPQHVRPSLTRPIATDAILLQSTDRRLNGLPRRLLDEASGLVEPPGKGANPRSPFETRYHQVR